MHPRIEILACRQTNHPIIFIKRDYSVLGTLYALNSRRQTKTGHEYLNIFEEEKERLEESI